MTKKTYHEIIAEKIIKQLKERTAPWVKPWVPGNMGMPFNPTTNNRYRGINAIHLLTEPYQDLRWLTYQQAVKLGGQVRRGEKGTTIQFWKFDEEITQYDDNKKPLLNKDGQPVKTKISLERPKLFFATVFNAEQIDGLQPYIPITSQPDWEAHAKAARLLQSSGATIVHNQENGAFYQPSTDTIHMPSQAQFKEANQYYATALHELAHWSGHPTRLGRDLSHPFGSEGYAREELRAEIASLILGNTLGIGHCPEQHVAYISCWIRILQRDPLEIFRAAADAEKIQTFIHSLEQEQNLEVENEVSNKPVPDSPRVVEVNVKTIWLDIPFSQIDTAKSVVGSLSDDRAAIAWDKKQLRWYARPGADLEKLVPWMIEQEGSELNQPAGDEVELIVPYDQKDTLKQVAGVLADGSSAVRWDRKNKSWFARVGANLNKLKPWLGLSHNLRQQPALSPREEFAGVLQSLGCVITGEHPIMDGNKHRIAVDTDKKNECSGFYVGFLDGHPAGYVKNNRSGVETTWKSKGYSLTEQQKNILQETMRTKQQLRLNNLHTAQEEAANNAALQLKLLVPVQLTTPYLLDKGILPTEGIYTDNEQTTIYIPLVDSNNKLWSIQTIKKDGTKRFIKDTRKEACFHVVGGFESLATVPVIVIGEGYATCNTIAKALGYATICAMDCGNLVAVAKTLREKYPDKPILIAGDDDYHLTNNPGKNKAIEAAECVGGQAVFPHFSLEAQLNNPEKLTDFNDLATKTKLGFETVSHQLINAVKKIDNHDAVRKRTLQAKEGRSPSPVVRSGCFAAGKI